MARVLEDWGEDGVRDGELRGERRETGSLSAERHH